MPQASKRWRSWWTGHLMTSTDSCWPQPTMGHGINFKPCTDHKIGEIYEYGFISESNYFNNLQTVFDVKYLNEVKIKSDLSAGKRVLMHVEIINCIAISKRTACNMPLTTSNGNSLFPKIRKIWLINVQKTFYHALQGSISRHWPNISTILWKLSFRSVQRTRKKKNGRGKLSDCIVRFGITSRSAPIFKRMLKKTEYFIA